MDQQFKTYEDFLVGLRSKFNAWILPGEEGDNRKGLLWFCVVFLVLTIYPAFKFVSDSIRYYWGDSEVMLYMAYSNVFNFVIPIGVLLMLRKKRAGWIIMSSSILIGVFSSIVGLYYSNFWLPSNSVAMENFELLLGVSWKQALMKFIIYSGAAYYIYSKRVREIYRVDRFKKILPLLISIGWVLLNGLLSTL